ncbi:MAG: hypothetical protein SPI30_08205 [Prevotella sp.]|nr:hypothetical protein [Prevotella sp.]
MKARAAFVRLSADGLSLLPKAQWTTPGENGREEADKQTKAGERQHHEPEKKT